MLWKTELYSLKLNSIFCILEKEWHTCNCLSKMLNPPPLPSPASPSPHSPLPCQAPGVIGSVLGLIGPVSVYWNWVRWKVWSATSISVWQHIKLYKQIRPWDTLACCWDTKQPTNNNNHLTPLNGSVIRHLSWQWRHRDQSSLSPVKSYHWLKNWHTTDYPASCLTV